MAIVDPSEVFEIGGSNAEGFWAPPQLVSVLDLAIGCTDGLACSLCGGELPEDNERFWMWRGHQLIAMHLACFRDFFTRVARDIADVIALLRMSNDG